MRLTAAFFTLSVIVSSIFAALIARQSLPNCAAPCLENADYGGCAQDDDSCLCHNQSFINSTTSCIESSCSGSDLVEAEAFAQQLCLAVGVTLTAATPTPTTTSSSTGSPSPSPSTGAALSNGINAFAGAAAALALAAVL